MNLEKLLKWYQQRISKYDKKSWETTVEQRILRGLSFSSAKTAKQKTDQIDVDLVRGSTFPKAKPQLDVWLAGILGVIRIAFLPFFFNWWMKEVSRPGLYILISVYCSGLLSSFMYFILSDEEHIRKVIPFSEVALPFAVLILLSVVVSEISCTRNKGIKFTLRKKILESRRASPRNRDRRPSRPSKKRPSKTYWNRPCSSDELAAQPKKEARVEDARLTEFNKKLGSFSADLLLAQSIRFGRQSSEPNIRALLGNGGLTEFDQRNNSPFDRFYDRRARIPRVDIDACTPEKEVNLRYRGKDRDRPFSPGLPSIGAFHQLPEHRSSDGRTDESEENACHADCETPATEDEDRDRNNRKSWLKTSNSVYGKVSEHLHGDCFGATTNSEGVDEMNSSTDSEGGWDHFQTGTSSLFCSEPVDWYIQGSPAALISATTSDVDKISCKIWQDTELKKVECSVLDISSTIVSRVNSLTLSSTYPVFGIVMALVLCMVPSMYRLTEILTEVSIKEKGLFFSSLLHVPRMFGTDFYCFVIITLCGLNRFVLGAWLFLLLSVAERIFKERFLCAKHFSYLTSARRARKYDLPHFRLNKVLNIKSWLSIRSCLKNRGPQHSVDVIVSATFVLTLLLVFYLGFETLKEDEKAMNPLYNVELFVWCFALSIYLIRFTTLATQINSKYSNPSVLIMEQINMYFQMEKNPHKKESLTLANNVLKLVSVLLKELDCPFKISGLSANTLLYNVTKFGILSACSGVLSNLLGFKLKLHNIKFR